MIDITPPETSTAMVATDCAVTSSTSRNEISDRCHFMEYSAPLA
jgi:hypothetical protein